MPKYTLPKLKEGNTHHEDKLATESEEDDFPRRWDREIRIPVSAEILKTLKVGESVDVLLTGKVEGLINEEHEKGRNRTEMTLHITAVEAYSDDNEFAELSKEDDD